MIILQVAVTLVVAATVACGSDGPAATPTGAGPGARPEVVVDGLDRPTQFVPLEDGRFVVAQLAGDEDAGRGQVVLTGAGSPPQVLLDGLDVPTGVALADGRLWVMEATAISVADWAGPGSMPGPLRPVRPGLQGNGRSQGSLTALEDGRILYATTGTTRGSGGAAPGTGTLWSLDPATDRSEPVAVGAKNAYATAVDADTLGVTEIGDAAVPPPDLLVEIPVPAPGSTAVDLGWPSCRPVVDCPGVVTPAASLPPGATPTGIAADDGDWLVALFSEGRIVRVPRGGGAPVDVTDGLDGPHSVVRSPEGRTLVSEHGAGRIVALP